jgi:hypothetical protein
MNLTYVCGESWLSIWQYQIFLLANHSLRLQKSREDFGGIDFCCAIAVRSEAILISPQRRQLAPEESRCKLPDQRK